MRLAAPSLALALLCGCASPGPAVDADSDAPEARVESSEPTLRHASYAEALAAWHRPQDVNAWIGSRFEYDLDRAVALSESQRQKGQSPHVFEPAAFYARPRGVCVDLARFAVESLRQIAPQTAPRYLMIEFDPATVRGQVLRRHWVAMYEGTDGIYILGDSKRPGVMAGPYRSVDAFVGDYARFRQRGIVSYRELDSYQRKLKAVVAAAHSRHHTLAQQAEP